LTFFPWWSCRAQAQPLAILEGQCLLSWLSPLVGWSKFGSLRISLFALAWLSRNRRCPGVTTWCACIGLGRHKLHYPTFGRTHPPATYAPLGPYTTPLTPMNVHYRLQNI
jgi:hypothetical protein